MKTNKGFTLIELLGVIIILAVLALLIIPTIGNSFKTSTEDLVKVQEQNIKNAAKNWAADHTSLLPETENGTTLVTVGDLKTGGYLDSKIKDPKTKEDLSNSIKVVITYTGGNYTYKINYSG